MSEAPLSRGERHSKILRLLEEESRIEVRRLAEELGSSEITIRRDLKDLSAIGQVRRVHGAAMRITGMSTERPFHVRAQQSLRAKQEIAVAALDLVSDGDSLALDVGSTIGQVVPLLAQRQNLTVITANLRTAWELTNGGTDGDVRLILAGGVVRPSELSMTGEGVREQLHRLRVDIAFIGVAGIEPRAGLTDFNLEDAEIKRVMVKSARRAIVLADHTKLGTERFARIADLREINMLITDRAADPSTLKDFREAGVSVLVAPPLSSANVLSRERKN